MLGPGMGPKPTHHTHWRTRCPHTQHTCTHTHVCLHPADTRSLRHTQESHSTDMDVRSRSTLRLQNMGPWGEGGMRGPRSLPSQRPPTPIATGDAHKPKRRSKKLGGKNHPVVMAACVRACVLCVGGLLTRGCWPSRRTGGSGSAGPAPVSPGCHSGRGV